MLFSILIAHYNNFEYFKACYQSILNQTYQNFEIILVDDCSTDGSFEKICELTKEDSRVKIHKNEHNKGVGFTKRKCVEMASGEICGFVDPDDALEKNALETMLQHYSLEKITAVYSQFLLCDDLLNPKETFKNSAQVKNENPLFFNIFLEINHFFTFRKSAYENTSGINPELTSAVDQDLYLKIYEKGEVLFVKKPLYLYRLHEKGVSQQKSKKGKLNQNWHSVLKETLKRRKITELYGKPVSEIENLPEFIFKKQNHIFTRLKRRFL